MVTIQECIARMHSNNYTSLLNDDTQIINVSKLLDNREMENYVVVGILYGVTHHAKNEDESNTFKGFKHTKKPKNYNRIFYFGGLDGSTFCYISESNRSSSLLFTDIKDRIAVGSPYLIYEPSTNKNDLVLKENQLEITSSYPLLPLNHNIYECMVDIKPKEGYKSIDCYVQIIAVSFPQPS